MFWLGACTTDVPVAPERTAQAPVETPEPDDTGEIPEQPPDEVPLEPLTISENGGRVSILPPPAVPEHPRRLSPEEAIDRILTAMTREERVGQLFMPAILTTRNGDPLHEMNDDVRELLETVRPGGVILFGANLRNPDQTRRLVEDLQEASPYPLIIAADQEGGLVSRLTSSDAMPASVFPSARRVGLAGDDDLAYELARATARELRSLGITMNFAPVADILTNPDNPVVGSRAYGSDPELVARMVSATVRGLQDNGVSAVVKHFPGHGDTVEDTHIQSTMVPHTLDRLRTTEMIPFVAGFDAGADGVMTAHISLPNIVGDDTPATLSPTVLRGFLRDELAYRGVIVTDSLTMRALSRYGSPEEVPLRAFQAGADLLLYPLHPVKSYQRFLQALRDGEITESALNDAVRRILRVKFARGLMIPPHRNEDVLFESVTRFVPDEVDLGLPEHQAVIDKILGRQ